MAAPKGNNYCRYSKEDVMLWEKYPKHFRFLPHGFEKETTDSTIIKNKYPNIYNNNICLIPNKSTLGLKRRKTMLLKEVKWGEFYVINAIGTSLYKIGHSTNFKRRYRDLSAASPIPLTVIKYAMCDNPNILEIHIHELLSSKYFKNEWFSLNNNDLIKIEEILSNYFQ